MRKRLSLLCVPRVSVALGLCTFSSYHLTLASLDSEPDAQRLSKSNTYAAEICGWVGRSVVKKLAFGHACSFGYDLIKSGAIQFLMPKDATIPLLHEGLQGAFCAMAAYPIAQSAQHGFYAFLTTLGLTSASYGLTYLAPYLSRRVCEKLPTEQKNTDPWIRASLITASGLIPDPIIDEQGVSIFWPFSNASVFMTNSFYMEKESGNATLHVDPTFSCHIFQNQTVDCHRSNETIAIRNLEDRGGLLAWGTPSQKNLYLLPHTLQITSNNLDRAYPPKQDVTHVTLETLQRGFQQIDQAITSSITLFVPWHFADATPITRPLPLRHINDKRELPQLLREDPDLFLAYLNAHSSRYLHDHSYSTAPAIFSTLFYDLGLQTGGDVFVYAHESPLLAFDNPQFVFIPPTTSNTPVIVASVANWGQPGMKSISRSQAREVFIQRAVQVGTFEYHFLRVKDTEERSRTRTQPLEKRVTDGLMKEFYAWRRTKNYLLDDMVHGSNLWNDLSQRFNHRTNLQERPLWRLAFDVHLGEHLPFSLTHTVHEHAFQRGRLHLPRMRSPDIPLIKPSNRIKKTLYIPPNIWPSNAFSQQGDHFRNLLTHTFQQALEEVTTDLRHMQDQFNNLYTAPIVDENFYKVITATKILNHKIQGDFFPMVEMQSGSGRIDMALISHDTHPSAVVFEFKYTPSGSLERKTEQAMHQISGRNYGIAFDRFPGVKSLKRVGITFSRTDIHTDFDTYNIPSLRPKVANPNGDLIAFKYQLETFFKKHVSYHDLNRRNPEFFPAFLSTILLESRHFGTSEIWASTDNAPDHSLFLLKATGAQTAISLYYTNSPQTISKQRYQNAFYAFQRAHPNIQSVAHINIFLKSSEHPQRGQELKLSDITLKSPHEILNGYTVPHLGAQLCHFPQNADHDITDALANLDHSENRPAFEKYLKTATEFEHKLFPTFFEQKEAHLQGLIVGILFSHPNHFDIISINEEGGFYGKRPDIIFKDAHQKLTVIENKFHNQAGPSLPKIATEALDQIVTNRYGDIVHKKDISKLVCAAIVFDANQNIAFHVEHDARAYELTDSPSHRIRGTWPTSREHTPEREVASHLLASHLATPPIGILSTHKRTQEDILNLSPRQICKRSKRYRRSTETCYALHEQEAEHLTSKLLENPQHQHLNHALSTFNTLFGGVLPITKLLIHGDVIDATKQASLIFAMPILTHQYTQSALKLAHLMEENPTKRFLLKSAPLIGHVVGNALNVMDLGEQIEHLTQATNIYDKHAVALSIAVDTGYIALDTFEMGALLAGSECGPPCLAAALALAIVDQLGQAGIDLERLEDHIRLSSGEKFHEYWRFFAGLDIEAYLRDDLDAKAIYQDILEQRAHTYLKSGQYSILVATLLDIKKTFKKEVSERTAADRRADDYVRGQSWCLFCDNLKKPAVHPHCHYENHTISMDVSLAPLRPSIAEFNRGTLKSLSRLITPPHGTRVLCAPSDHNVKTETLHIEHGTRGHRTSDGDVCTVGDYDQITQTLHWPSTQKTDQPFCQNAFVLANLTSTSHAIIYHLENSMSHTTPSAHPATLFLRAASDPSKTAVYDITLSNPKNTIIVPSSWNRVKFHIRGGQYNTLLFQSNFSRNTLYTNILENLSALIGSPQAQRIIVPKGVSFVDGMGGTDNIVLEENAMVALHNNTHIYLYGDRVGLFWPALSSGMASVATQDHVVHTYNLYLSHLNQLSRIHVNDQGYLFINLINPSHATVNFDLYIAHFRHNQEKLTLQFSPPLEGVISTGHVLFYKTPLVRPKHRTTRINIKMTGTSHHWWRTDLDEALLRRIASLGSGSWQTHTQLISHSGEHALWIDPHSHVTQIAQPQNNTLVSLTIMSGNLGHHYVIQDWIKSIFLYNTQHDAQRNTYDVLTLFDHIEVIAGVQGTQHFHLNTQTLQKNETGFIRMMRPHFGIQINQHNQSYGLFEEPNTADLSLLPCHFLKFHTNRITTIPTDMWHQDDRLRISTNSFEILQEGQDGLFYDASRNATLVLKSLKVFLNFRDANHLWLETPRRKIDLTKILPQTSTISEHIQSKMNEVLNTYTLFQAIPTTTSAPPLNNGIIHLGNAVVYDLHAQENGLDIILRDQTAKMSRLYIPSWNAMGTERPLMINAQGFVDFRNQTAQTLEQQLQHNSFNCSQENHYDIFDAPHILWFNIKDIPHLHVYATPSGFAVTKQFFDTQKRKRCTKHHFLSSLDEAWILFYDHTIPYNDIHHNEFGVIHIITPSICPLKINVLHDNVRITPIPFLDTQIFLKMTKLS